MFATSFFPWAPLTVMALAAIRAGMEDAAVHGPSARLAGGMPALQCAFTRKNGERGRLARFAGISCGWDAKRFPYSFTPTTVAALAAAAHSHGR
ncbi:MAG: hypothetical protein LBR95_01235 [Azoarcus sp.]|jgi:hypothetical protein|nr:hypothetical protein [Azoarcus sp.]